MSSTRISLAGRIDVRIWQGLWGSASASYKPWGESVKGQSDDRGIVALNLTYRWSSFAPL